VNFDFVHEFSATPALYWELFFDADYNTDMFKRLRMKEYKVLEFRKEGDGETLYRTQRLIPERQVPGPVRKAIGGEFGYVEKNVYHRSKSAMDVVITPTIMSERFDLKGVYGIEAVGADRVRRYFRGTMKVSFPLLGGQIEKFVHNDMRDSYDSAAAVTKEWLEKWKQEGKTTGHPPVVG
jgi:hypothetical protein